MKRLFSGLLMALSVVFLLTCASPVDDPLTSAKGITSFSFKTPQVTGTINGTNIAITVPLSCDLTTMTAIFTTTGATVKAGDTELISGTTILDYTNPVVLTVYAKNGSSQAYTVTVTKKDPEYLKLAEMKAGYNQTELALSPAFSADITDYSVSFPYSASIIQIQTHSYVGMTVDLRANSGAWKALNTSNTYTTFDLNVGPNVIQIRVTDKNQSTKTYTVNATRAAPVSSRLSSLSVSSGTLSPEFTPETVLYSVSVANSVSGISVTPVASVAESSIAWRLNGGSWKLIDNGASSPSIPLATGNNAIEVYVKAAQGELFTYTINVNRAGSSNAQLSSLYLSNGSLSPSFSPSTNAYTVSLPNNTYYIGFTPTASSSTYSSIEIKKNGVSSGTVTSGRTKSSISLDLGLNTFTITVTAEDGSTNAYTVAVTRDRGDNANLASLTVSAGTLTPAFDPATTAYTLSLDNATTSFTTSPGKSDTNAGIKYSINGSGWYTLSSGNSISSGTVPVGSSTLAILVTALDGTTTKTYSIAITREGSNNPNLTALYGSPSISPSFSSTISDYSATVSNATTNFSVKAMSDTATVKIRCNGGEYSSLTPNSWSSNLPLTVGKNVFDLLATSQDGSATKTYTITVTRTLAAPTSVTATTSITTATLSWASVPEAAKYAVYRSSTSGGTYNSVGESATNSFTDTSLTQMTTYYYKVKAIDLAGLTSDFSSILIVKTRFDAPTGFKVIHEFSRDIYFQHDDITYTTAYNLYRATSTDGPFTRVASYIAMGDDSRTKCYDMSLPENTTYYYKLTREKNGPSQSEYESEFTDVITASTKTNASLSAPTDFSIKSMYCDKANFRFINVSGATGYRIFAKKSGSTTQQIISSRNLTGNTSYFEVCSNMVLDLDTTYDFSISAYNADGETAQSATITGKTLTEPIAPTGLTLTDITSTGCTLSWNAVSGNNKYDVYDGGGRYAYNVSGTSTSISSLSPGYTYDFTVITKRFVDDYFDESDDSTALTVITPASDAPQHFVGTASSGQVQFTWSKLTGANRYDIYKSTSQNGTYDKCFGTTETSIDWIYYASGTYYFKIVASTSGGDTVGSPSYVVLKLP